MAPAKSASMEDDLRGEVQKILAGRDDGGGSADPFDERNEWEDAKRSGKSQPGGAPAVDKPKSRRAQQALVREAAKPVDPKAEAEKLAKASAKATQNRRPQPVNVPAWTPPQPNAGPVLLPVCASWWEEVAVVPAAEAVGASDEQLRAWRVQAEALYERELGAFASRQERTHGADHRMVQRLLQSGTWKDRIAALTVQAQESAYHALPWVRQLLALAQRPARDVQVKAIEALSELFLARLLPP